MMPTAPNNKNGSGSGAELTQQQQQQQQQQWLAMQQYQHQQWMAMQQYPAAAVAMQQQQMMYQQQQQPQYIPYQYHYQQQQQQYQQQSQSQSQSQGGGGEDNKSLWIGDLPLWMDETFVQSLFPGEEAVSVKIIRNKQTRQSERFGFIEFASHEAAEKVLQTYNGTIIPNSDQNVFRLNWATFSTGERHQDTGSDLSIFVGDLASDVNDAILYETFAVRYQSVRGAKVVVDTNTGRSKGYGFVRFGDENERSRAMNEMNGQYCSSRAMRIGVATPKKPSAQQQYSTQAVVLAGGAAANGAFHPGSQYEGDTSNTTVFVGGLDSDVTDEELRQIFSQFGEVLSVKIPIGKGCGFVQFADRTCAEDSINQLNGTVIGKQTVRLSWGRNQANKQFRTDSSSQWNGNSYGKQAYDGYGYNVPQNQVPNMYTTAYGASTNGYGNQ